MSKFDGYINWNMLVKNTKSIALLKQSLSLALDRMEIQKAIISALEVNWDFGLTHVERLFELHKPTLDKPQSMGRIIVADAMGKHSPELVTKGQFKLLMVDEFKVRDDKLLDNIFLIADVDGEGALDIRELCAVLILHMRGSIELKLALFFEMMKNRTVPELEEGGFILKTNLLKIIDDALKFFKQAFF